MKNTAIRWTRLLCGAAATVGLMLMGVAPAQAAPPSADTGAASAPTLVMSLPGGTVKRTATVISRETGAVVQPSGVAANTCYLGGSLPSLLPTENFLTENVYFSAQFHCDLDVVGTPELTSALQSGFMGAYTTEKIVGPYRGNPVGVGVIVEKDCGDILIKSWRGAAHPRLITDAIIYDWGWIPTYDSTLRCP